MRWLTGLRLAPEGRREIIIIISLAVLGCAAGLAWYRPVVPVTLLICGAGLAFFRDPQRTAPPDGAILLAPADGRVTHINHIADEPLLGGPASRISIFLSIFDVHINRAPCAGRVETVVYRRGRFRNAMSAVSSATSVPIAPIATPRLARAMAGASLTPSPTIAT